ncbi:MAG: TolC family protein [Bacteroidales bacterium]|nr:TolC family protein [Bacteroidales bacterium]
MIKKFKIIILFYLFLFSGNILAQENATWTLNDCIKFALNENLQIKQSENNNKIAENNYKQSYLILLPNLNTNAGRNLNYGDKFNIYTGNYEQGFSTGDNFSVSSNLTLFNGFYNLNTIKKNKLTLLAKEQEAETIKNNLIIDVVFAYLNILFNMELYNTVNQQIESTKSEYKKTKILIDANKITKNTLFDIEAQLTKEEYFQLDAQNNLNLAYLNLYSLLNIELKDSFKISLPDSELLSLIKPEYSLEEMIDYSLKNNPKVTSSEYEQQIAETNIKLSKSNIFPKITIFGHLTTSYSSAYTAIDYNSAPEFTGTNSTLYITESGENIYQKNYNYSTYIVNYNNQLNDNLYNYFGANLSIPIFNGGVVHNNIQNSKIEFENANYSLEITKNEITEIITKAYYEAELAFKKYVFSEKMYKAQKLSYENAKQKYNAGTISFFDFRLSKAELYNVNSEMVQAKYDYLFKTLVLDFYMDKKAFF